MGENWVRGGKRCTRGCGGGEPTPSRMSGFNEFTCCGRSVWGVLEVEVVGVEVFVCP